MSGPVQGNDVSPVAATAAHIEPPTVEITTSRTSEVGGHTVLRALPRAGRRTVGPWCFVDHLTPSTVAMDIGPHPHVGLQTVTWLLEGEVVHYDSVGSEQPVRPGQLNLMSAGRGVAHAEESVARNPGGMHGVQLWLAQPEATRMGAPAFEHHADLPRVELPNGSATVMLGSLLDAHSPARQDTPTFGADIEFVDSVEVPLNTDHEYAVVVLEGEVQIDGHAVVPGKLAYLGIGSESLVMTAATRARCLLIGGQPFEAKIFMWWNFVTRTQAEATDAFRTWNEHAPRFGTVGSALPRIDAPIPPWMPATH